jgi:peptidoglycan/LPS O-acetylase OafA/YrhL
MIKYRKDIQIIRGLAVLLVVFFHLEIGGFKSGFLGVDIFFVISGFLMALLYDPKDKKKFFERRILRLLPTYFMVTFLTILTAFFVTIPNEFGQLISQSIYASTFTSNIGFWTANSYFSKIDFNPLLHLWSLGVEIQFYLIIPLLVFLFRLHRHVILLIILLTILLSFMVLGVSPKTSFFMMPLRMWEFLVGYAVAYYFSKQVIEEGRGQYFSLLALFILLVIPLIPVDGSSQNVLYGHPGLFALLITLATATILCFGLPQKIVLSKIGSVLEVLGKYSYSIYLVHFPIIVLYLYHPFSGTVLHAESWSDTVILLAMIVVASVMSYHLFEEGFRKLKAIKTILFLFPFVIVLSTFFMAEIQKGFFTKEEQRIIEAYEDRDTYRCGKLIRITNPSTLTCSLTELDEKNIKQKILFLGNSHADSIKLAFTEEAKKLNSELYFFVSNSVLLKNKISAKKIIEEALNKKVDTIVVHYSRAIKPHLSRITELIKLAEKESIYVIYLMDIPRWERDIPKALWLNLHEGKALPSQTLEEYFQIQDKEYRYLKAFESKYFKIYQSADVFCRDECALVNHEGRPLYFDDGHLTVTGSRYLSKRLKHIIVDSQNFKDSK